MSEKFIRVTSGPSALEVIEIDTPGAGQNFSTILEESYTYLLLACSLKIVASVAVANRTVSLEYYFAGSRLLTAPPRGLLVATETLNYSFYVNADPIDLSPTSGDMIARLPTNLYLPGGVRIVSVVHGIDVGDQISDVTLYLQKWPVLVL